MAMIHKKSRLKVALLAAVVIHLANCGGPKSGSHDTSRPDSRASSERAPAVLVATVILKELNREIRLPGELLAYQDVAMYSKVPGFVEWIGVDRGSIVKSGQVLVRMSAPELQAQGSEAAAKARAARSQRLEAESRVQSVVAQRLEAEARLASSEATYKRLKAASATAGVVAGNDLEVAQRTMEADRARLRLWEENEKAARTQVQSLQDGEAAAADAARSVEAIGSYLHVTAPFAGVITDRNVHKGSFTGPSGGPASAPMLRIQQVSRLRLVVSVPETDVGGIFLRAGVSFGVRAFPGQKFIGVVRRVGHSLDARTRTMPVELDVDNPGRLAPGMFAEVSWPVRRPRPSLFVPGSSVATTTERTFVVRIQAGMTEWVDVKRGATMGELVEVFGNLAEGDQVAVRGTDELREGTRVVTEAVSK